jgi:hypothetical protein
MNLWKLLLYKTPPKIADKVFQYIVRGGRKENLLKNI